LVVLVEFGPHDQTAKNSIRRTLSHRYSVALRKKYGLTVRLSEDRRTDMTVIAFILSLMVVAFGALGVISPRRLLAFVQRFETPAGLYSAAAFRLVLGLTLLFAAPDSRAPDIIRIIGIIIVVAGLITPLIGIERFRHLLAWWSWWSEQKPSFMRAWAGLALVFGMFIAYAVLP